jgi:hypothetical protein
MINEVLIVSEWLLFNAKWAIFQLYQSKDKSHFDEMMMISAESDSYSASSLKQQTLADMSLHWETLSWFWANQFHILWFDPNRSLNPWSTTLEASILTITPPMWFEDIYLTLVLQIQKY